MQVFPSAKGIRKAPGGGIGHGVDGKIPAAQVRFNVSDELHPIGVAAVCITALGAEGGDLHRLFQYHRNGAVFFAAEHQSVPGEDCLDLLRGGSRAKVVVMGVKAQKGIPHATAYGIGRKAGLLQRVNAVSDVLRQLHEGSPALGRGRGSVSSHMAPARYSMGL